MKLAQLFSVFLLAISSSFAANVCVGPSATGSGSGADWSNLKVWTATPVRGDVWYLKDGTYAGRTLAVAESGSTLITFKKAIGATGAAGHGTDTGWNQATMGSGQATISSLITLSTGYWIFDGQIGDGFSTLPPGTNGTTYGITMIDGCQCITMPAPSGHLTLSHIYAPATMNDSCAGAGWFVSDGNTGSGTVDGVTVSYCLLVGWGQAVRADMTWTNLLFDHNCYWTIYASSVAHANPINASWGEIDSAVIRYNLFYQNVPGTWGFSQVIAANNNNVNDPKIYGNVFDHCWAGRSIISGNGRSNDAVYNGRVFNNTFIWSEKGYANDGGGLIGDEFSSGNSFVNNLSYSCRATVSSVTTNDYNLFVDTWNQSPATHDQVISNYYPFVNASNQVYTLLTNTTVGTSLTSEYNTDALGNTRSTWTRGAFEFVSGGGGGGGGGGATISVKNLRVGP